MYKNFLKTVVLLSILLLFPELYAQKDTTLLDVFTVTESRRSVYQLSTPEVVQIITTDEIAQSSAYCLPSVIKNNAAIDIRQRGIDDVQADISINGGSFEQTLLLVNGIPFNNPQTGHHNFNLPFSLHDIETIEIYRGAVPTLFGANAMTGAVNIITKDNKAKERKIALNLMAGEFGFRSSNISLYLPTKEWGHYISVGESKSDGYTDNTDFKRKHIWFSTVRSFNNLLFSAQGGVMNKFFGANSFYTPAYPDQAEEVTSMNFIFKLSGGEKLRWMTSIYQQRDYDRFELFRYDAPAWYQDHNYHLADVTGIKTSADFSSAIGLTRLGAAFKHEKIVSNVLGYQIDPVPVRNSDAYYDKGDNRNLAELSAEHNLNAGRFSITAGLLLFLFPDKTSDIFPAIDMGFALNNDLTLNAKANRSFRIPTYTDLFYRDPVKVGNEDLVHEEAVNISTGITIKKRSLRTSAELFFRDNRNLIDWTKYPEDQLWQSRNLTRIITKGTNIHLTYVPLFADNNHKVSAGWTWIMQSKQTPDSLLSYYVLDHLRHKAFISGTHKVFNNFNITWSSLWQDRAGTYTSVEGDEKQYPDVLLIDAGINYRMSETVRWELTVRNILNSEHFDFSGVVLPGRWVRIGLSVSTPF